MPDVSAMGISVYWLVCRILPSSCLGTDIILCSCLSCILKELLSWGHGNSIYPFLTHEGPSNKPEWDQVCDRKAASPACELHPLQRPKPVVI